MEHLRILGRVPLRGTVAAGGAKNAALPIMAASILAGGPVQLAGVPGVSDVATLTQVLRELGMRIAGTPEDGLRLETEDPRPVRARYDLVRRMRASFCVLGPLLARRGRAAVALPGGCNLGPRPVDLHLRGLAALGADIRIERGNVIARAKRLRGATVALAGPRGPTVTGTANVMTAAVLARGVTTILGAAIEPEVVDLGRFLNALGARITGLGTPTLRIAGVEELGGASYRIIPDRIEAGTLLLAVAITQGSATLTGVIPEQLSAVLSLLDSAGASVRTRSDRVKVSAAGRLRPLSVVAEPYPGIPSDLQAPWTAVVSLAGGRSSVSDRVFPGRFAHVDELNRLGARIGLCGATAIVEGVSRLSGTTVVGGDLRACAALVLAGLAAEGETRVLRIDHLDRGYERLDEKLARLGARIERADLGDSGRARLPPSRVSAGD